jgi:hypothetical protein
MTLEYIIFGVCVFGAGLTSYYIGRAEGVTVGAATMYDHLVSMSKPNPDNEYTVLVELEKPTTITIEQ